MPLGLSGLLTMAAFPQAQSATAPYENEAIIMAHWPFPQKFGRWVNRRTKPIGLAFEKVTPFRLVKYHLPKGCGRCFPADTRISLLNGATCPISELRVGQAVLGWNPVTRALDTARVKALATVVHDSLWHLSFADGRTVTATADHPFWVNNVGWASLVPALTTARYATRAAHQLQAGDSCLVFSDSGRLIPTRLSNVAALTACGIPTYTITRLSRGHLFFANELAVGVEGDKQNKSHPFNDYLARRHL